MKRYRIKQLFSSALRRLERSFERLPSVDQEAFERILGDLEFDFDEYDVKRMIEQFDLQLFDMECWLDEIAPKEQERTYEDKKALERYFKAIKFAQLRLRMLENLNSFNS